MTPRWRPKTPLGYRVSTIRPSLKGGWTLHQNSCKSFGISHLRCPLCMWTRVSEKAHIHVAAALWDGQPTVWFCPPPGGHKMSLEEPSSSLPGRRLLSLQP